MSFERQLISRSDAAAWAMVRSEIQGTADDDGPRAGRFDVARHILEQVRSRVRKLLRPDCCCSLSKQLDFYLPPSARRRFFLLASFQPAKNALTSPRSFTGIHHGWER